MRLRLRLPRGRGDGAGGGEAGGGQQGQDQLQRPGHQQAAAAAAAGGQAETTAAATTATTTTTTRLPAAAAEAAAAAPRSAATGCPVIRAHAPARPHRPRPRQEPRAQPVPGPRPAQTRPRPCWLLWWRVCQLPRGGEDSCCLPRHEDAVPSPAPVPAPRLRGRGGRALQVAPAPGPAPPHFPAHQQPRAAVRQLLPPAAAGPSAARLQPQQTAARPHLPGPRPRPGSAAPPHRPAHQPAQVRSGGGGLQPAAAGVPGADPGRRAAVRGPARGARSLPVTQLPLADPLLSRQQPPAAPATVVIIFILLLEPCLFVLLPTTWKL